jgi:hypothetical protein
MERVLIARDAESSELLGKPLLIGVNSLARRGLLLMPVDGFESIKMN